MKKSEKTRGSVALSFDDIDLDTSQLEQEPTATNKRIVQNPKTSGSNAAYIEEARKH